MATASIRFDHKGRPAPLESKVTEREAIPDSARYASPETAAPVGRGRQASEALVLLGVVTVLQHRFPSIAEVPALSNLYWIPVLLASCQYGLGGGTIATIAASALYLLWLSPQSAAQDFYAYGRIVAIQPAVWLATALVFGGMRSLHIHQYSELAAQLAASRRRGSDLTVGLERAKTEIGALERRIAVDMGTVAAFTRTLSVLDMGDRMVAAAGLAELFRIGTGAGTFAVYLREGDGYVPVCAVEAHNPSPTNSIKPLSAEAVATMLAASADNEAGDGVEGGRFAVAVPPGGPLPLAAIVGELKGALDPKPFRRRAEELGRLFATVLSACHSPASEARP
jgi:hypothetical protein